MQRYTLTRNKVPVLVVLAQGLRQAVAVVVAAGYAHASARHGYALHKG